MKWIRDFDKVGKRERIIVSIGVVVSGCLFSVLGDVYVAGYSLTRALVNLNILIAISMIFMGVLIVRNALRKKATLP